MTDKILLDSGPSARGWHRIEAWLRCKLFFALRYLVLTEGADAEALVRGSLVHVGCAHRTARRRAIQRGEDPNVYYQPDEAIALVAPKFGSTGLRLADKCLQLVQGYIARYDQDRYEILQVEEQVEMTLGGQHYFTQRYDWTGRDPAGKVWIFDIKTCSAITKALSFAYSLSGQFLIAQAYGQAKYGRDFGGVRLDFVQHTPPYKLERNNPMPAPFGVSRIVDTICRAEEEIARYEAEGVEPLKYPGSFNEHACFTRYGTCPYFTLCQFGIDRAFKISS